MSDLLRVVERARENPMFAEDYLAREHPGEEGADPTAPPAAGGGALTDWPDPLAPVLAGRVVRLEPLSTDHDDGLWEASRPPEVWTWVSEQPATRDELRALPRRGARGDGRRRRVRLRHRRRPRRPADRHDALHGPAPRRPRPGDRLDVADAGRVEDRRQRRGQAAAARLRLRDARLHPRRAQDPRGQRRARAARWSAWARRSRASTASTASCRASACATRRGTRCSTTSGRRCGRGCGAAGRVRLRCGSVGHSRRERVGRERSTGWRGPPQACLGAPTRGVAQQDADSHTHRLRGDPPAQQLRPTIPRPAASASPRAPRHPKARRSSSRSSKSPSPPTRRSTRTAPPSTSSPTWPASWTTRSSTPRSTRAA